MTLGPDSGHFGNNLRFAVAATLLVMLSIAVPPARAAEARFQRVALLPAADRVSLVFELTGEPKDVNTRRVSAAVLELDAGPVTVPSKPTSFMAPPGVRFVMGVSIQGGTATDRLKARITLLERARSVVRVVGRRVYVDFSPDEATAPAVPPQPQPQLQRPAAANAAAPAGSAPAAAPASTAAPTVAATAVPAARETYRANVQPAVERFEQLTPFMVSAAASPSESVLKAVGNTLIGIQGLLLSVEVSADAKHAHDLLSSAVTAATKAMDPAFSGDRSAQAKLALALLDQAKSSL
jgi:hypothetical protein